MQRLVLFALTLLVPAVPALAQARRDSAALVIIECESQNGACAKQHVVTYEFGSGRYLISNWGVAR